MTVPNVGVFPGLMAPLLVDRPMGIAAVESAASQNLHLALFWSPRPDELEAAPELGVAARILRLVRLPAGHVQILLQGAARVRRVSVVEREPVPRVQIEQITPPEVPASGNPLREAVLNSLKVVASLSPTIPQEVPLLAANAQDAGELADLVAAALDLSPEEQQRILELIDPLPRLQEALRLCEEKARYLEVSQQIQRQVGEKASQQQREYILREQLRTIQRELGELDPQQSEMAQLREQVESKGLPEEGREEVSRELSRLESINPASP